MNSFFMSYKNIFDPTQLKHELSVIYSDIQFHNKNIQECIKILKEFEISGLFKEV